MRNKKLIPFEVIEKAVAGEPEAVDAVLQHYTAYIKYLSMYKSLFKIWRNARQAQIFSLGKAI